MRSFSCLAEAAKSIQIGDMGMFSAMCNPFEYGDEGVCSEHEFYINQNDEHALIVERRYSLRKTYNLTDMR